MSELHTDWQVADHGSLTEVGIDLWSVEGSIAMPLGSFPRRMTVIRLAHGGLAVWSPVSLEAAEMARLDALGPVEFLIAPNQAHRLDLAAWKARYPGAQVIAPPGAAEQVAEAALVDATHNVLGDPGVVLERVAGTKADEFALILTRRDGVTLILNDILASVSHPHGLGAKIMAHLFGFGVDHPQTSRLVRNKFVADPAAVAQQFRHWAALPQLRRVIVSHVDIITDDPAAALERAASEL